MNESIIRAATPIFLSTVGLVIALSTIVTKPSAELAYAAFNLASVALGAAGGSTFPKANENVRVNRANKVDV